MFADTTLNMAPTPGDDPIPVVVKKIREDNFSSEFLAKTSTYELRMRIRHSKENGPAGSHPFDRHNVELTKTVYPTAAKPLGSVNVVYLVIRMDSFSDGDDAKRLVGALFDFVHDDSNLNLANLLGWVS